MTRWKNGATWHSLVKPTPFVINCCASLVLRNGSNKGEDSGFGFGAVVGAVGVGVVFMGPTKGVVGGSAVVVGVVDGGRGEVDEETEELIGSSTGSCIGSGLRGASTSRGRNTFNANMHALVFDAETYWPKAPLPRRCLLAGSAKTIEY